jgi:hypothetical protein
LFQDRNGDLMVMQNKKSSTSIYHLATLEQVLAEETCVVCWQTTDYIEDVLAMAKKTHRKVEFIRW